MYLVSFGPCLLPLPFPIPFSCLPSFPSYDYFFSCYCVLCIVSRLEIP